MCSAETWLESKRQTKPIGQLSQHPCSCRSMFSDGRCCSVSVSAPTVIRSFYLACLHSHKYTVSGWFYSESICLAKAYCSECCRFKSRLLLAWRRQAAYQCIVSLWDSHSVMRLRACTNERLRVTPSLTSVTETSPSFFTITSCCISTDCFHIHAGFTAVCV